MSFAQTYILALKVRTKLVSDASGPNTSLRRLVVQANMLDSLMELISDTQAARIEEKLKVTFSDQLPEPSREPDAEISTYEVDSDEDLEDDDDIYYESSEESEEDEDWEEANSSAYLELERLVDAVSSEYLYMPMVLRTKASELELPALEECQSLSDSEDELLDLSFENPMFVRDRKITNPNRDVSTPHISSLF